MRPLAISFARTRFAANVLQKQSLQPKQLQHQVLTIGKIGEKPRQAKAAPPSNVFNETVPSITTDDGKIKQVFWLRVHSLTPFPRKSQWDFSHRHSLQRRHRTGFRYNLHPFPYSPLAVAKGTLPCLHHNMLWFHINILCSNIEVN